MRLESLNISLNTYGEEKGKYSGKAYFKGQYGGIDVVLSPEVSKAVLKLCADALVQNSKDVANNMTAEVIESSGVLLENKAAE